MPAAAVPTRRQYQYAPPPPAAATTARRCPRRSTRPPRDEGWIGKVLAVAGVAVTLIGVVLLLVLAAQAGILRPEIRVGAGAVLAGGVGGVAVGCTRPGGRVGAIALAATGVAAAYMDVIAITTIYDWVSAPVGLGIAAVIGGGGLTLARRWNSQHLGLLVLVPLIVLAPIVTDGITMLLSGSCSPLRGLAARPTRQGLDLAACRADRGDPFRLLGGPRRGGTSVTVTTRGWPERVASPRCSPSSAR